MPVPPIVILSGSKERDWGYALGLFRVPPLYTRSVGGSNPAGGMGDLTDHPCERSSDLPVGAGAVPEFAPATPSDVPD